MLLTKGRKKSPRSPFNQAVRDRISDISLELAPRFQRGGWLWWAAQRGIDINNPPEEVDDPQPTTRRR